MFIVFEGLDGSGKGTQIDILAKKLREDGKKVFVTCEPTGYDTGKLLREALGGRKEITQCGLAGLFLTDRVAHCTNKQDGIAAMLKSGCTVICDRYYYSSFAYQGMDTDLGWVIDANLNCPEILKPDVCIYLDVSPEECDKRIESGRDSREIFEEIGKIRRIRDKYMEVFKLLKGHNIKIVKAVGSPEEIAKRVYEAIFGEK